ncbi:hypothetical protein E5288_WYG007416 [Bos mutus]|uniref:Uncharacterized protein n=1 Tax=Bos mutus TaxID=72004 RepID=A0A6B0S7D3_9CETA|nr:hypothetical protein [Bos mutus]
MSNRKSRTALGALPETPLSWLSSAASVQTRSVTSVTRQNLPKRLLVFSRPGARAGWRVRISAEPAETFRHSVPMAKEAQCWPEEAASRTSSEAELSETENVECFTSRRKH